MQRPVTRYTDTEQAIDRRRGVIGTVYRATWPDGSRARTVLCVDIDEALALMDPFQAVRS